MKRIYSLDFLKLFFAYLIALAHANVHITPGFIVIVQLFFIISGFLLGKKYYSRSYPDSSSSYNQWDYTKDHLKSLYPHYLFSLIMVLLYVLSKHVYAFILQPSFAQVRDTATFLYDRIPELLLLQNAGFFNEGIQYPLWYLSATVISGYFIFGLLCVNEKLSRQLIFPAAILMIQTFLGTDVDWESTVGFFYVPLLRAFSPMCIGVLTYHFTTTELFNRLKRNHVLFQCISLLSLLCIFVFGRLHNIYLLAFVMVLLSIWDESSWINRILNRKIFRRFGDFSYAIYLNHALLLWVLGDEIFPFVSQRFGITLSEQVGHWIYVVVLTVYSLITLFIVDKYKQMRSPKVH